MYLRLHSTGRVGGGTLPLKSTPLPPQLHPQEGDDSVADTQYFKSLKFYTLKLLKSMQYFPSGT